MDEWRAALEDTRRRLDALMDERPRERRRVTRERRRTRGRFDELKTAIDQTRGQLRELEHAAEDMQEEGALDEELGEMRERMAETRANLRELMGTLEERQAESGRRRARETRLVILPIKHTSAFELAELIERFLTPSGIIATHEPTNSLVIRDAPAGLETAQMIIRKLDVPDDH